MQLSNILISFLFAAAVSAKGNRNGTTSIKSECKSIAKLTKITNLAANETKLALKFEGNQTAIDAFIAKAAEATTELTTLSANATLTEACAVIQAHEDSVDACDSISKMENLISKAANTTRLESKTDGNATKIAEIQAKASAAATKLAELQSNTTLTTFCAAQADLDTCSSITKLQKQIAKAASSTIEAREKGNSTRTPEEKAARVQAKAAKAQEKLDALMANATLVSLCSAAGVDLSQAATDSTNTTDSTAAATTTAAASRAGRIEVVGSVISAGLMALFAGMLMM